MVDPDEIVETPRTPVGDGSRQDDEGDFIDRNSNNRKGRRRNPRPQGPAHSPLPVQGPEGKRNETDNKGQKTQQKPNGQKQSALPTEGDHQARFYDTYHKVAEEYDKDFLKKYGGDLDTTLIFAGLFSAVTSAFIIEVDSKLQPDPSEETAALLRVLIYKIDSTTFGNEVPPLPQWNGPPPTMVHVQAILLTSLAASLLSALLAMLGKQWLNRYDSSDVRGSAIARSRNRQRKLDGIDAWCFVYMMESLPLMLQAALLLLGCALSRYLWEISTTVALVVIGVTSFGLLFYLSIVIAGAVSKSCPYQTPGSPALRYVGQKVPGIIRSVASSLGKTLLKSTVLDLVGGSLQCCFYYCFPGVNIVCFVGSLVFMIPLALPIDAIRVGFTAVRGLGALFAKAYHIVRRLPHNLRRTYPSPAPERLKVEQKQKALSDLRCISWTLRTFLDKDIRLSTVQHLETKTELVYFDPSLVVDPCFDVLVSCINVSDRKAATVQGKEELAAVSAKCLLRSLYRLLDVYPQVFEDFQRRCNRTPTLNSNNDFTGLPFCYTMTKIQTLVDKDWTNQCVQWGYYKPSAPEYITFARNMVEAAQAEYQQTEHQQTEYRKVPKVPRWILRFALHSLSQDCLPPTSVVADCLTIVAIDLGCDVLNIPVLEESERVERVTGLIIQTLKTLLQAVDPLLIISKHKAICTIFSFAVFLERDEKQGMFDLALRAVEASRSSKPIWGEVDKSTWREVDRYIATLLQKPGPPSLHRFIALTAHYRRWRYQAEDEIAAIRWATAVLEVRYTEETCRSAVDTALQIVHIERLRPHIPVEVWAWLKKQPILPPQSEGRSRGTNPDIICHVRGLGDLEILKSYFVLLWSEWTSPSDDEIDAMEHSIRTDFCGTRMEHHRKDFVRRLDHILGELDRGLEYFRQYTTCYSAQDDIQVAKGQYGKLKGVLLEVEREAAMTALTRYHSTCALPLPCP